jgi:hypothetical protein
MSQWAVNDTLNILEKRHYSGVISPHGWMDPGDWPRIWKLGGMAFPGAGSAKGFVDTWRAYRPKRTPYYFGWGYGADLGGLATQGAAAAPGSPGAVTYPFRSIDGATTVNRQRTGDRVFDYATEGVAHYGLYADWLDEVQKTGGPTIRRDMLRGSEAYLEMWERAVGVPSSRCLSSHARFGAGGLGGLRLGLRYKALLERAGQPLRRTRAWSYCVKGKANRRAAANAVLTPDGSVALIATSAEGQTANGVGPGASVARVRSSDASPIGGGVWTASLGNSTIAYVVRGGTVRTVALAGSAAASEAALRAYLRLVPRRGVSARPTRVIGAAQPGAAPGRAVPLGVDKGSSQFPYTLHGSGQFPFFCGL